MPVTDHPERPEPFRGLDVIPPPVLDAVLVILLIPPTVALFRHGFERGMIVRTTWLVPATLLAALPLLVRRRWPVGVLMVSLAAALAIPTAASFSPPALAAIYVIASRRPWPIAVTCAVAAALALDLHRMLWGYHLQLNGVLAGLALSGAAVALGLYRTSRLAYFEQTRER